MKKNAKNLIVWGLFIQVSKIRLLTWNFYTLYYMQMKNYELFKRDQFKNCQATECRREDEDGNVVTIFYSYSCPELVKNIVKQLFSNEKKRNVLNSSLFPVQSHKLLCNFIFINFFSSVQFSHSVVSNSLRLTS